MILWSPLWVRHEHLLNFLCIIFERRDKKILLWNSDVLAVIFLAATKYLRRDDYCLLECVRVFVCVCSYACVCVCVCVCLCVLSSWAMWKKIRSLCVVCLSLREERVEPCYHPDKLAIRTNISTHITSYPYCCSSYTCLLLVNAQYV